MLIRVWSWKKKQHNERLKKPLFYIGRLKKQYLLKFEILCDTYTWILLVKLPLIRFLFSIREAAKYKDNP